MTTKLLEYVQSVRPAVRISEPMVIPPPNGRTWSIDDLDALYLRAGVRLVWLVYPETQVVIEYSASWQVRRLTKGDALDAGAVIPGFTMPLARLFR